MITTAKPTSLPSPTTMRDLALALALFVASFAVYHASPVVQLLDARFLSATSYSLIENGSFAIPPIEGFRRDEYRVRAWGDGLYHWYPNAPAVLNLPFVLAFDLAGISVFEDGVFRQGNEIRIFRFAAAAITAMSVALGFLLARSRLTRGWALALAGVYAFGTSLYSTASRAYWGHAWGVALLTLGLFLLIEPRLERSRAAHLLAGTALAWACFCRPTFALSAIALTFLVMRRERRRHLLAFVVTGAVWAGLFVVYSYSVYGQSLPPYFGGGESLDDGFGLGRLLLPPREAVLGTLFDPSRGLFVFHPFLALVLAMVFLHWRRLARRDLAILAIAVTTAHWLLLCGMRHWWGGGGYGSRTFTDTMPWILVLTALALDSALRDRKRWSRTTRFAFGALAVTLVLWSLFVHARGATSPATIAWGDGDTRWVRPELRRAFFRWERLGNWRYPQFLAGLVPAPPPERFVSWLCDGEEELKRITCGDTHLRLRLSGEPGGGFSTRLSTDEVSTGELDETGFGIHRVSRPADEEGRVTVVWDCGTVITGSWSCGEDRPPAP